MSTDSLDAGIPVLTEIIPASAPLLPPAPVTVQLPGASAAPALPALPADPEVPFVPTVPALAPADIEQIGLDVQQRVMTQMMMRVDETLELRVRDCLADVLQASVDRLARELREGLQQSIREAVSQAVAQEIAELKQAKN
jgi:hypothetical protein